jgi:hypothetical protein
MTMPVWIKTLAIELAPNLISEFIGVNSIKKFLQKGREQADTKVTTQTTSSEGEQPKEDEVKRGGMFNLDDEEAYFKLLSGLDQDESAKISKFIKEKLEPWQRRRFRASIGNLGTAEIPPTTEWVSVKKSELNETATLKQNEQAAGTKSRIEYESKEKKSGGGSINLGVKFLKSFAQLSEDQMLDVCEAAGVMHSDFDSVGKAWGKLTIWAENQGPQLIEGIDRLTREFECGQTNTGSPAPSKPSFLRNLFGL